MDAPKCRLCGNRHWGDCSAYGRSPAITALSEAKAVNDTPPEVRARAAATFVQAKLAMLAPPGQCPHCDARRADNAARVRLHRQRKRE